MSAFRHWGQAWLEVVRRYRDTTVHFWRHRKQNDLPRLTREESEFQPNTLALQTRPVSPAGRWAGRLIMGLLVGGFLLAYFGEVDIIVNADGKVAPVGEPKVVAAAESSYVASLFVKEGAVAKARDPLVQLDDRQARSDEEKALGELHLWQLQFNRSAAFLRSIEVGGTPILTKVPGIEARTQEREALLLLNLWQDYTNRRSRLEQEISKLGRVVPLLRMRADDHAALLKSGDVAHHAWAEREQARIEAEAQMEDMKTQLRVLRSETRKSAEDSLREADRGLRAAEQDHERARVRREQMLLRSPVDGVVQQLAVHTVGGVAPAAQGLMQIVPLGAELEVQVVVENKDIGFLSVGQPATLKINTFDFTKYGTLPAKVSRISPNAIDDEKRGLIYNVALRPEQLTLMVGGEAKPLTTGQAVKVEIRTGQQRVIQYVLSPLVRHVRGSLHER